MKPKLLLLLLVMSTFIFSQDINSLLEDAGRNLIKQDFYQAIEDYKKALQINEFDIRANRGLSDSYYLLGEYDEALLYIDRCLYLNKNSTEIINLKARILTALEQYDLAEELYLDVLKREMYSVDAKSGLAELRLISGDLTGSLYDFEQILEFSPGSRRLLLSLTVLYDSQKRFLEADEIIQKAIRIYPSDPIVLEAAVRHYMKTGSYKGASIYMGELLMLSDSSEVLMLNAELLLRLEDYESALESLNRYMRVEKDNSYSYYLAALLLDLKGDKKRALSLIDRGLEVKPDEELYRFYREMLVKELYLLKDNEREEYADWYLEQGTLLEDRYYYDKARSYYLRGLDLAPFSQTLRLSYANILKKTDFLQKYLRELKLIFEQDEERLDLAEIVDIQESITPRELYQIWGEERFESNEKLSLSVFISRDNPERHIESSHIVKSITERFLSGSRKYSTDYTELYSGDYSDAFSRARELGSDYFILMDYFEGSRTFSISVKLYLTRSGREIKSLNYLKTGNSRIFNCFENFSKDLEESLPVIGSVVDIKNSKLLIDLGMSDNIKVDSEFIVLKRGSFRLIPERPFIDYPAIKELGVLVIKDVGETMSSGEFTANSTFNLINIGDEVILLDKNEETETVIINSSIVDKELIDQLLRVN